MAAAASPSAKSATRKPLIGGNWKSNGLKSSIDELVGKLNESPFDPATVEVVVAPTALHIGLVRSNLRKDIAVAAQNASVQPAGAFTGEINALQLKDFGVNWVILGHSERRHLYGESDKTVSDKVKQSLGAGLHVIACIGELLAERKAGQTLDVCTRQLKAIAEGVAKAEHWERVVIAYEPVWAINTGHSATPEQAQQVHASVREWLSKNVSAAVAGATRVIYGGSVSAANCDALMTECDIDGFLVGGASLKGDDFSTIMQAPKRQTGKKKPAAAAGAAAPAAAL